MGNEQYEGFDRLTTILDTYQDPKLIEWKIKLAKEGKSHKAVGKAAMSIGTNVDEYIRAEINGVKLPKLKTQEAANCVIAWNKWKNDYGIVASDLKTGERLFCEVTKVTGEPDIIIPFQDEVLDIKCSGEIRPSYWIQTNWLAKQLGKEMRSVLRLDKTLAVYEYERRAVSDDDSVVFHALTVVYRYFKPEKEVEDEPSSITQG